MPPPSPGSDMALQVRHDRSSMLAEGVFTLQPKSGLDAWNVHSGDTVYVNFRGPQSLQPEDLRVLHAVAATGFLEYRARNGLVQIKPGEDRPIVSRLELKTDRNVSVTAYVTSLREIASQAGMGQGSDRLAATFKSLQRLSEVTIWTYTIAPAGTPHHLTKKIEVEIGGFPHVLRCTSVESSRLLHAVSLKGNGGLRISLNPRETVELLGQGRNYTVISMTEARQIKGSATGLLHARLCAFIDPGKHRKVSMVRLQQYVYGDPPGTKLSPNEVRTRRRNIQRALHELSELGWQIEARPNDHWEILRPNLPGEEV